jgi:hypothetical protein
MRAQPERIAQMAKEAEPIWRPEMSRSGLVCVKRIVAALHVLDPVRRQVVHREPSTLGYGCPAE